MPTRKPIHRRPLALHDKRQQPVVNVQAVRYEIAIDPVNASFYVTENGVPIARFNDHHKATSFVLARLRFPEPDSDGFQPADKLFQEEGGAL